MAHRFLVYLRPVTITDRKRKMRLTLVNIAIRKPDLYPVVKVALARMKLATTHKGLDKIDRITAERIA